MSMLRSLLEEFDATETEVHDAAAADRSRLASRMTFPKADLGCAARCGGDGARSGDAAVRRIRELIEPPHWRSRPYPDLRRTKMPWLRARFRTLSRTATFSGSVEQGFGQIRPRH